MKRLLHPATIIAAVALFVALGGGAWASSLISGSSIKNHSISEKKLTNKAIKALHGARGAKGAKGSKGDQGTQGIQGIQGVQGVPGPSNTLRWDTTATVRDVVGTSSGPNLSNLADTTGIVTVATFGTLKVDGICWDDGTNTYAATFVATTQDGAIAQGYSDEGADPLNVADGPVQISEDIARNTSTVKFVLQPGRRQLGGRERRRHARDGRLRQPAGGRHRCRGQLQVLGLPRPGGRLLTIRRMGRGAFASRSIPI